MNRCKNAHHLLSLFVVVLSLLPRARPQIVNSTAFEHVLPKCTTNGKTDKPALYFLAMAPYPLAPGEAGDAPNWVGGPEVIPGAMLAAQHINCNPIVLPDYQLKLIISNGGCNQAARGSANMSGNVYLSRPADGNVVGIVGGACSESALVVAKLVDRDPLSLVQIAPSATSPVFVINATFYRNTMRLAVSALVFIDVFTEIIKRKEYKEVAILYEAEREYMVAVSNEFAKALQKENVTVDKNIGLFKSYLVQPLEELRSRHRLIFVFAGRGFARKVLCLAANKSMLYPNYQLIFINRRPHDFLVDVKIENDKKEVKYFCNKSQMEEALPTATLFEPRVTRDDRNAITVSGYTYNQVESQYNLVHKEHRKALNRTTEEPVDTEYQNAYYDSTWALALSLNRSQDKVDLSTYKFGQPDVTRTILNEFFELSFEGATGKVEFNNSTFDTMNVAVVHIFQQLNSSNSTRIARYSPQYGLNLSNDAYFVNQSVIEIPTEFAHPPHELGWIMISLGVLVGLGIAILHCLNRTLGNMKTVKATSPQLNHLIFSGCYLLLLAMVVYSVETTILIQNEEPNAFTFGIMCNAQVWINTYALSMVFGTISMKTWRIFRIFNHFSSTPIQLVDDFILIGFVVLLVIIDTVFLTLWSAIDPLYMQLLGSQQNVYRAVCGGDDNFGIWFGALVFYKALVIILLLYLSIVTRKINRKEFKQTKSINTLVYILIFVVVLGVAPYLIVTSSKTTALPAIIVVYVIYCVSYILSAVMCAIFVFLPPIYPILVKKWRNWRLR